MQFPLEIDGFKNRELVLEAGGFFSGPRLLLDGEPAPKQVQAKPKKEFFLLRRDDGREVVAELRARNFLDSIPTVTIDGKTHEVVAPLPWYCWVWAAIPFGLVAIGGPSAG